MLVLNYYYNAYEEIDVQSLNNGTDTSNSNVAVIVGATIGGVFLFVIVLVIIIYCCCCDDDEVEEVEITTYTVD